MAKASSLVLQPLCSGWKSSRNTSCAFVEVFLWPLLQGLDLTEKRKNGYEEIEMSSYRLFLFNSTH